MRVYFARHGESQANLDNTFSNRDPWHPLTLRGEDEARVLAGRVAGPQFEALYCSPAVRARQTAEIVGQALGLAPRVADELREFDVGRWEGTNAAEGWAEYREVVAAWLAGEPERRVSGGESLADIERRVSHWLEGVARVHAEAANVVAVAHGGVLHAGLPAVIRGCELAWWPLRPLGHCDIVVAESRADGWQCLRWGDFDLAGGQSRP